MAMSRTGLPEDEGRRFIITYFKADRTVVVREPPKRNSGIIGGNFLSRMKVRCVEMSLKGSSYSSILVGCEETVEPRCSRVEGTACQSRKRAKMEISYHTYIQRACSIPSEKSLAEKREEEGGGQTFKKSRRVNPT